MAHLGSLVGRLIKLMIAVIFYASRGVVSMIARRNEVPSLVVLMYHSVKPHERDGFALQMRQVTRAGAAVYADCDLSQSSRGRFIAVTFDDAYHSVVENALPVLRDQQIPSTIFVPTKYIGGAPGWIVDSGHRDAQERLMTHDELREASAHGTLIGSHSVSHPVLPQLDWHELVFELTTSRSTLEKALGKNVTLFALPYGLGNEDVVRQALSAGYARVFLAVPVGNATNIDGPLVGRIDVSPTDWRLEYALKLRGAYQWLPAAIAAKTWCRNILRSVALTGSLRTN